MPIGAAITVPPWDQPSGCRGDHETQDYVEYSDPPPATGVDKSVWGAKKHGREDPPVLALCPIHRIGLRFDAVSLRSI